MIFAAGLVAATIYPLHGDPSYASHPFSVEFAAMIPAAGRVAAATIYPQRSHPFANHPFLVEFAAVIFRGESSPWRVILFRGESSPCESSLFPAGVVILFGGPGHPMASHPF